MNIGIRNYTPEYEDKVIELLNEHFSFGLMTKERLYWHLSMDEAKALVAVDNETSEVVGFVKTHRISENSQWEELEYPRNLNEEFFALTNLEHDTGIAIDLGVVKPDYLSLKLIDFMTDLIAKEIDADYIFTMQWVDSDETLGEIISKANNRKVYKKYWEEFEYPCPKCGDICKCDAIVYTRCVRK